MGTRGFIGFVVNDETKVAYCHWSAYPGGLGTTVLNWLAGADLTAAKEAARALRVVTSDDTATAEDIEKLRGYADFEVGGPSEGPTWYQLLRRTQGDPAAILAAGVLEDAGDFPADSLFAEWGFVVDFDRDIFEAYEGFQEQPHRKGRFALAKPVNEGYYPVKLRASWPLSALPTEVAFLAALEEE
jgi:hypothetical protein